MHTWRGPAGVDIGTDSKRLCATHLAGDSKTLRRVCSQSFGCINSPILTVSPLLHIAVFTNQPSSLDHAASRGSRVSGSKARQVGSSPEISSHVSGKRLLSLITDNAGLATGVFPPRKKYLHPIW